MPAWTLGDLMSHATTRVGRRSDIVASTVSFWVNQAIQDVTWESSPALLEKITVSSTTSGENRVTLPADTYEVLGLAYLPSASTLDTEPTSALTLRRQDHAQVDAQGFSSIGRPTQFVLYADYMELWPSPDSSYSLQLRYRAYPSDITNTSAVPSLDTEWRFAALLRSEQYLHEYLGNDDAAAVASVRYLQRVTTLKDSMAKRQASGHMRMSLPLRRSRCGSSED